MKQKNRSFAGSLACTTATIFTYTCGKVGWNIILYHYSTGAMVVVRASALHSVDPGFIFPSRIIPKNFKKWYSQIPCLAFRTKGTVRRTSQRACLLCLWARRSTKCFHLYVTNRWWGQAVYPSWWPSLTKDVQTEHELIRINK